MADIFVQRAIEPQVYVASMRDYASGRRHGRWVSITQPATAIEDEIAAMLAASPDPDAAGWAIHDYVGLRGFEPESCADESFLADVGQGIVEHGAPFAHWANHVQRDERARLDNFEDRYLGILESLTGYAEAMVDELGEAADRWAPRWLAPFVSVDFHRLGQTLSAGLHVGCTGEGLYLFRV